MIYALASRRGAFGVGDYLKTDGQSVAPLVTVLSYEDVLAQGTLAVGAYLFTGLDDLTPTETALVVRARAALAAASPSVSLLNDPTHWLRRGALLQAAFDAEVNTFRATRATVHDPTRRFPVFIRSEPEHTGALSPLLYSPGAVVRALLTAMLRGYRLRDLLIVEYSDTADADGVFTKYSAMIVGPHIVPRSHTRSREQITKFGGRLADLSAAQADAAYVRDNPHEAWLRQMFALGGVQYGRIDYAMRHGAPQLWEINTNPTIGANLAVEALTAHLPPAPGAWTVEDTRRMAPGNQLAYAKLATAISALSDATHEAMARDGSASTRVTLSVSRREAAQLVSERALQARILARRTALAVLVAPLRAAYRLRHSLRARA